MTTSAFLERRVRQRLNQIAATVIGPATQASSSLRMSRVNAYLRDTRIRVSAIRQFFPTLDCASREMLFDEGDLFKPTGELVEFYPKPKASGRGYRLVCDFGPILTLRHKIIAAAVDAQLRLRAPFFDREGTGVTKAVASAAEALRTIGPYMLVADITDCFPSINIEGVYQLGILPPEVVEYALDHRQLTYQRKEDRHTHNIYSPSHSKANLTRKEEVPQGLLQGCSASNAILRHLLTNAVMQLDPSVRAFVYVDNFYVVASSERACRDALETLSCHLADCPAGPLLFGHSEIRHVEDGVDILGYHLISHGNGRIKVDLSAKNLTKIAYHLIAGAAAGAANDQLRNDVLSKFPLIDSELVDFAIGNFASREYRTATSASWR